MTTYGVTATGFVDKPIEIILAEIEAAQKAALGTDFDVSAQTPEGQLNGIFSAKLRELWEVAQALHSALDPDKAEAVPLAALASLTGTLKQGATKSTVTATVNLDAGKTLFAGAIASVLGNATARFVSTVDVTNSGGTAADVAVPMEAETAGPVVANAGTLTVKVTSQPGWHSITNAADALIGQPVQTDGELRVQREIDLRRSGSAALDAIKANVVAVTGVTACNVFENATDATDVDGVPAHAIEVLVTGGAANDIAQAIWGTKAGGVRAYGLTSGTAYDVDGVARTMGFSRPTAVPIYLALTLTTDVTLYPADGDTLVKAALALWSQENLGVGADVIVSRLGPVIFAAAAGIIDVVAVLTGTAPGPSTSTNTPIGSREQATIDTANVAVTSGP